MMRKVDNHLTLKGSVRELADVVEFLEMALPVEVRLNLMKQLNQIHPDLKDHATLKTTQLDYPQLVGLMSEVAEQFPTIQVTFRYFDQESKKAGILDTWSAGTFHYENERAHLTNLENSTPLNLSELVEELYYSILVKDAFYFDVFESNHLSSHAIQTLLKTRLMEAVKVYCADVLERKLISVDRLFKLLYRYLEQQLSQEFTSTSF